MGKYPLVAMVAAAIVLLDQATKWWVAHSMTLYESIPVIDSFVHLTYVQNRGGAFSILADQPDAIRLPFFIGVAIVALAALVYFLHTIDARQRLLVVALAGILGGALGNFIDRATRGAVIDFVDVHWRGHHWPAFNVADSFITTGTIVVLLYSFLARDP